MSNYQFIITEIKNQILYITINRADKLNALNSKVIQEIGASVKAAQSNNDVAGIILTGAGEKAFVAGADISEFSNYTQAEGKQLGDEGQKIFKSLELSAKPIVAAINGFALGGGCELAMCCHIRVASPNAKFGQPEVKLGLIPGYAGTQRLIQLIGKGKAFELLMTADMIGADEALQLGLINYVVPQENLITKAEELINKIKLQSPKAIAAIVQCVDAYFTDGVNGFETEVDEFGKCFGTSDFKEGVAAFLEKRKPAFA